MRLLFLLLARWASAERNPSSCEADDAGVCLLQQTFLHRSTQAESKVGISPIPESNSGSYCRLKDVMPYWSVPGKGSWTGMTKFALSCDGEFSFCDRVREAAETQCRLVVLEDFACVGGAGQRDKAVFNGPLMPIPDSKEKFRFAALNDESTFEVDENIFLCSMFGKIMEVDESQLRFDSWRLRVTKTRSTLPNEPGKARLAIQDLDVHAESVEHGHTLTPMSPAGEGEYVNSAGPLQVFDNRGEDTWPLIDTGGAPGAITWSYDEPVCISEIRLQTAKEGWWNCDPDGNYANCADPVQWVLEGEEKLDSGEHMDWVPVLIQDLDYPMPDERATYTDFIPVQKCDANKAEKEATHAESKAEVEQNAGVARTRYRFNVKKARPGHSSGRMMFHMQEIEFDADRQPVRVRANGGVKTAGAGPEKLIDHETGNNPYVDKSAVTQDNWHPVPVEFEFEEPTCIRAFRIMTSKQGWWSCGSQRCGDPLQWELEGYDDAVSKNADEYGLSLDLVGSEWVPVQLQYEDYPVPMAAKEWTDWIPVSTCGGPRYFDEFRFTLVKTPGGHSSGNMIFALDEFEIDAVGQTTHNKLEAFNPENVNGHSPAGGADVSKAFDGMVGVDGNLPFVDDSAAQVQYSKTPGTLQWSLRETGCLSRFRFATAPAGWWTCGPDGPNVCADPIQWTLEGKLDQNGADWVMLQDQSSDYPTPTTRSTFTDWIPVSDCEKSEKEHARADANAVRAEELAAQRRLAFRFRMTKGAKPHWSGRMLLALAEFELDTDPPVPMNKVGILNPGGSSPDRAVFLTDGQVMNGGPFLDTSSVDDDTKAEVAPLEFHFESAVCINKFRFATPQDAENAWWYGEPPNEEFGVPSQWVFEAQNNDEEWVAIQTQATDFNVPSQRGAWADWVTVATCSGSPPASEGALPTNPLTAGEDSDEAAPESPAMPSESPAMPSESPATPSALPAAPSASPAAPSASPESRKIPVLQETATVEVQYKHVVGYTLVAAAGAARAPESLRELLTYAECEEVCTKQAGCAGFNMLTEHVRANAKSRCHLYTAEQWKFPDSPCKKDSLFDLFIKPSVMYDFDVKCP